MDHYYLSNLEKDLGEGKFVLTSEFSPPKGAESRKIEENAGLLINLVVAANVSGLQGSNLSMSAIGCSCILRNYGLEPVLQITCRDRNRLALQSDLLSAYVMGIKNILVLTGDYTTIGDHPGSKPVFDLDSVQLLHTISRLEEGYDLSGNELTKKPMFFKGAAVNPEANTEASYELQLIKMKKKVDHGAQFFQTMPVFNENKFFEFIERTKDLNIDVPIIVGIQLIKSKRMADYINKNIPGVNVPQSIIDRIDKTNDKVSTSIDIASSTINKIKKVCQGIHIGAQGWEKHIPRLIENIDLN